MTGDELRATIERAITGIIDAVNTYAAGQIALAVTPRKPAGEPALDWISFEQLTDMMTACGMPAGFIPDPVTVALAKRLSRLHETTRGQATLHGDAPALPEADSDPPPRDPRSTTSLTTETRWQPSQGLGFRIQA